MRWSIIRLIWLRELRDQMRDRRTLFMIFAVPLLLYPVLGYAVLQFAFGFADRPSFIGVVSRDGVNDFPVRTFPGAGQSPLPLLAWISLTRLTPESVIAAAALADAGRQQWDYPPLIRDGKFVTFGQLSAADELQFEISRNKLRVVWNPGPEALAERKVDVIVRDRGDFFSRLNRVDAGVRQPAPGIHIEFRPNDDYSKQAHQRLQPWLDHWTGELRRVRLARHGFDIRLINPFEVDESGAGPQAPQGIFDLIVRIIPFMLVIWSLAGALYPAVDLCAGEKERGTMETLLITPAGRAEIVTGKFLTIWLFSAASALFNLISMGVTTWQFSSHLPQGGMPLAALFWCILLSLPLSALFAAVSLAVGAYARSSKEGQYYLMPLFLITMPPIFLTLAPGVELNPFYSLVPVTGVALLMQRLMTSSEVPWLYFIPVLAPIGLYSWLALRWAIDQFQREEVLFREAERIDIRLWAHRLLSEKEATPTTGQAYFCFTLILVLRWFATGLGQHVSVPVFTSINLLGFVAAPVLFMTLLLNTQPRESLALRWPSGRDLLLAAILALLLLPPFAVTAATVLAHNPHLAKLLEERQPLMQSLRTMIEGTQLQPGDVMPYLLAFAFLPAVCEELAFRGFMLTGLRKRFRPRTAVLLTSFLFALFHMNVFQFLPTFFLGVVLGLLTLRSKSLLPAMFLHLLYNAVLLLSVPIRRYFQLDSLLPLAPYLSAATLVIAMAILWWLYRKPYVEEARAHKQSGM